jgi:hypothetical protein
VDRSDKLGGLARLDAFVRAVEARYRPRADFDAILAHERAISPALGGRSVSSPTLRAKTRALGQVPHGAPTEHLQGRLFD